MQYFVACPKGIEELLSQELSDLGAVSVRMTVAGVYADGDLAFGYRACLWSRLANRVLLPLERFTIADADDLYQRCRAIDWTEHLQQGSTFAIQFSGTSDDIRNTQFGAQRVKDAVVDRLRDEWGFRPEVDAKTPDVLLNVRLSKHRGDHSTSGGKVAVSLDLSGGSLHRRGYRAEAVPAPLKENLAAAILLRAGWPAMAEQGGALIDPLCGSGTLLIEGAMMAADIAPALARSQFGFEHWVQHDEALWSSIKQDAEQRKNRGLAQELPEIRGYDKDTRSTEAAETNILHAGLSQWVRVSPKPIQAFKKPTHKPIDVGLVVTNPPYGERWGEVEALHPLYQSLGERIKAECPGWTLAVFTANPELASELRLRTSKKYKLFNGTIAAQLFLYQLRAAQSDSNSVAGSDATSEPSLSPWAKPQQQEAAETVKASEPSLSEQAVMLMNRLKKNHNKLKSWLVQSDVSCYRLYDSDLPEYAVAIDIYSTAPVGKKLCADAVHVQEYAPPASVDIASANRHLSDVRKVLQALFPEQRSQLFFKERRRQKGGSQYRKQSSGSSGRGQLQVQEGRAKLEINLADYLDSGLFLDHRPVRQMIGEIAEGARFLNLFCYTATATVQAAIQGAASSLSVDMSNNYLEWAKRNFQLNKIDPYRHQLLREDCLEWLAQAVKKRGTEEEVEFDLIFLDPPTFSNSSKMSDVLDIQRDHDTLIRQAMELLSENGVLLFSNNFRKFKMSDTIKADFAVEDITQQTIPPDFARNQKIHNCWVIRHAG